VNALHKGDDDDDDDDDNNNRIPLTLLFVGLPTGETFGRFYMQGIILIYSYTVADRVCNTIFSYCVLSSFGLCLNINYTRDPKYD
jgi:hypothetical protein